MPEQRVLELLQMELLHRMVRKFKEGHSRRNIRDSKIGSNHNKDVVNQLHDLRLA
jgi:hypothetical protein